MGKELRVGALFIGKNWISLGFAELSHDYHVAGNFCARGLSNATQACVGQNRLRQLLPGVCQTRQTVSNATDYTNLYPRLVQTRQTASYATHTWEHVVEQNCAPARSQRDSHAHCCSGEKSFPVSWLIRTRPTTNDINPRIAQSYPRRNFSIQTRFFSTQLSFFSLKVQPKTHLVLTNLISLETQHLKN